MIQKIKNLFLCGVFIAFSLANAGSFEDFFVAVRDDDASAVKTLLQRGFDPNTRNVDGQAALYLALRQPSPKVLQVLLDWPETNVDVRNQQDESPLMIAALKGDREVAKKLIEREADVNKTGWTPLHYAATGGQVPIIDLLIEHHAYIDAESPNGSTPLMMAARYGSDDAVRLLLREGADPSLKNQQGLTAIDFAQRSGRAETAGLIADAVRGGRPEKGKW